VPGKRSKQVQPDKRLPDPLQLLANRPKGRRKVNRSAEHDATQTATRGRFGTRFYARAHASTHKLEIGPREHGFDTQSATHFDLVPTSLTVAGTTHRKWERSKVMPSVTVSGSGYCFKSLSAVTRRGRADARSDAAATERLGGACSAEPTVLQPVAPTRGCRISLVTGLGVGRHCCPAGRSRISFMARRRGRLRMKAMISATSSAVTSALS
jgi:hypothetical protein